MALTDMQERFCREYLIDLNQTAAAERAGFSAKKRSTAQVKGSQLMEMPEIRARILELIAERDKRTDSDGDRVILELKRLAYFDPKDLVKLRVPEDIAELPEEVRRAIVGWKFTMDGGLEIKFAKESSLQNLGRHHGLFNDKLEVDDKTGIGKRLEAARARRSKK